MQFYVTTFIKGVSKYIQFPEEEQNCEQFEKTFATTFVEKGETQRPN